MSRGVLCFLPPCWLAKCKLLSFVSLIAGFIQSIIFTWKKGWEQALGWWEQKRIRERGRERERWGTKKGRERPGGKQMYCSCGRAKKQGSYPDTMLGKMSPYYQSRKASLTFSRPPEKHDTQCICTQRAQDVWVSQHEGISTSRIISYFIISKVPHDETLPSFLFVIHEMMQITHFAVQKHFFKSCNCKFQM